MCALFTGGPRCRRRVRYPIILCRPSRARQVYAVDASEMSTHCRKLMNSNGLANRITIIRGKIEEVCISL